MADKQRQKPKDQNKNKGDAEWVRSFQRHGRSTNQDAIILIRSKYTIEKEKDLRSNNKNNLLIASNSVNYLRFDDLTADRKWQKVAASGTHPDCNVTYPHMCELVCG